MKREYGLSRPVKNAYLVRERDRQRWRELAMVLLAVLPLALAVLSYTWIRLETLRTGYRIDELERDLQQVLRHERQLRLEASSLSSPSHIEERARHELGLEPPTLEQMVFLAEEP